MSDMQKEIERRRTFAIISHPDAGKTTLTEKFLLSGGAIQLAGSVKGKAAARHAVSDWMELEKQRGISITSSVLQFEYEGFCINILDTPGHQDFSEDTYRTLMAADSAVMVIDGAKGIEPQTRKLFRICAMRHIPIFTFINKCDRDTRSPYDLLEELESEFGSGSDFKGIYDREEKKVLAYQDFHKGANRIHALECPIGETEAVTELIGQRLFDTLSEDVELLDGAGYEFDLAQVRRGALSPVYFGSALMNFGVEQFLESFLRLTTPPLPRETADDIVDPFEDHFSAFVFKIQANMNKAHRDRIAFMRICSGKFERNAEYFHVQGNKSLRLAQPQQMMAESREVVDEAYAGDIIGVFDPGIYSIGDTICDKSRKVCFEGIPTFAPEHFAMFERVDTMKRKQFETGIRQIAQEGAIQIFHEPNSGLESVIVGVVGTLQFDVLEYRLRTEYSTEVRRRDLPQEHVRWIVGDTDPSTLELTRDTRWVQDFKGNNLLLFTGEWLVAWTQKQNPGLELAEFSR